MQGTETPQLLLRSTRVGGTQHFAGGTEHFARSGPGWEGAHHGSAGGYTRVWVIWWLRMLSVVRKTERVDSWEGGGLRAGQWWAVQYIPGVPLIKEGP